MSELISEKQVMRVERREQPVSTGIVREGLWRCQSFNEVHYLLIGVEAFEKPSLAIQR